MELFCNICVVLSIISIIINIRLNWFRFIQRFKISRLWYERHINKKFRTVPCFIFIDNGNTNRHFMYQEPNIRNTHRLHFFSLNLATIWAQYIITHYLFSKYRNDDETILRNYNIVIIGATEMGLAILEETAQHCQKRNQETNIVLFDQRCASVLKTLIQKYPMLFSSCNYYYIGRKAKIVNPTGKGGEKGKLNFCFIERSANDTNSLLSSIKCLSKNESETFVFCCLESDTQNIDLAYRMPCAELSELSCKVFVHQLCSSEIINRMRNIEQYHIVYPFGMESKNYIFTHDRILISAKKILAELNKRTQTKIYPTICNEWKKEYMIGLYEMVEYVTFWEGYSNRYNILFDPDRYRTYGEILFTFIKTKKLFAPEAFPQFDNNIIKYEKLSQEKQDQLSHISELVLKELDLIKQEKNVISLSKKDLKKHSSAAIVLGNRNVYLIRTITIARLYYITYKIKNIYKRILSYITYKTIYIYKRILSYKH